MKPDKNVMDMTDSEIFESYNLFEIKPADVPGDIILKDYNPLFIYRKCSILKDNGVQYSNYSYTSQEMD